MGIRPRKPESYVTRDYRHVVSGDGLVATRVCVDETDLHIFADRDVEKVAQELVVRYRLQLETHIAKNPLFLSSLEPLPLIHVAPPIIREMLQAGIDAGVGPMAAVAGAVARYVGMGLVAEGAREIIVENGGDIFLHRHKDCTVSIFAGQSPLSYNVGIRLGSDKMPCGVCTSSGTIGHSLSFGDADSVTVVADSTSVADAVATRLGNEVGRGRGGKEGVSRALECAGRFPAIRGVVVICNEIMGAVGDIELVKL
ncbi:UPF0280 family protein [Desulfopila aestuarii]|uniref:Uncharacterized protein n=1 Tax=Desulfopila aestuarii DSM 18488 TaxID=1121416 RepID=A0A1M7YFP1_9BACT|nr:UPF0280 family protein [Desulfopila aestuarii]SHO51440.1 hypothetical protein SAMN02745220_04008 [Desulfopila aestuarii DSM 18488]